MGFIYRLAFLSVLLTVCIFGTAQGNSQQYPLLMRKAWFGVELGSLNYPFSNKDLPSNYQAQRVDVPAAGVRLTLFGYHFTKNLSARITYMRPVQWVHYVNLNGDLRKHSVWMNVGGLTVKQDVHIAQRLSLFAETGLALITRHGFDIDHLPVIADANYSTVSVGGGIEYHLNSKWDFNLYSSYCPGKATIKQPHTVFVGTGFSYNINPQASEPVADGRHSFARQLLQASFSTNRFGYGVNHFFAEGKVPVFWGGLAEVEHGWSINYMRNIFHTRRTFALDIGTSIGGWESNSKDQNFYAVSVYPVMRFNVVRTKLSDYYFFYSVAGPTYLSRTTIDGHDTGRHFTFRDYMGLGSFLGPHKLFNAEVSIGHFSNGNLFPSNAAVKIPLNFSVGYIF